MEKYNDKRREIKDVINKQIAEHKSNLSQVKSYVEKKFHKHLSTIDVAYIEEKYIKYCERFWLQETTNFLKQLTESKSCTVIQEIFNSLDGIHGFSQICNPLKQLEYYTLLMKHYELVRKEDEQNFIHQFKNECLEQIVAYSDTAKKELVLLQTLGNFLSSSKNLQSIITELQLVDFDCGDLSFDNLIKNIMKLEVDIYGQNLMDLQEATECLKERDLFLIDKFKEVIGAYIKPIGIQERRIDDRAVVEVTGKNIVLSEILQQLEIILLYKNIEEVRFVGADIIHVDTNIESAVWQGMNVVILTKAIKVCGQVTWNVSGKDNNHTYSNNADTAKDCHGEQGKDGYPGESGGNVLIVVEKIQNPENFTIISNGGRGSKGQNGGDGKDGDDGKSITDTEFRQKFPPLADFGNGCFFRDGEIKKCLENIDSVSSARGGAARGETVWCTGANNATIQNIIEKLASGIIGFDEHIFIKKVTNQENEITFSYASSGFLTYRQGFFLYTGSSGKPGGSGGEYGLGGQGGYAGEIIVRNLENSSQEYGIMKHTNKGNEGAKGVGGLYGHHGENGWDMGYMDYAVSNFFTEKWPKFFGADQNSKLTLKYYKDNSSDCVWCPYEGKYAKIIATKKTISKKQKTEKERKNTRRNSELQHHAQAVKKKNISLSSILASYSHHLNSMEKNTLQKLRSDLNNTKRQALLAINENQEQREKRTTELRIKRHYPYYNKSKHNNDVSITTSSITCGDIIDVESFIVNLAKEPLPLDNWFWLTKTELNLSQCSQLFSVFGRVDIRSADTSKLQDIQKLLLDKYRLATLQKIARQLPSYQEVTDNVALMPGNAVRYLIEAKENDNNITHPVLGTLNQYLYENSEAQREKMFKFYKEKLQNEDNKALKCFMRTFVLEKGKSEEVCSCIKQYYDGYKEFSEGQIRSSNIFFEAFKSELSRPRHAEVYSLFIESIKVESLRSKLEEKLQEDRFLNTLYNRFNSRLREEFDWNKCYEDEAVLQKYDNYIREKNIFSESYRELLAYVFDINIRLYVKDQDNKMFLRGDHNPSSEQIIYILCRDNKFIQLNIDKKYLKLEEDRKKKDGLYAKIFAEIHPLKQKEEFDDYSENKVFQSNNNPSEHEQYFNEEEDIEKIIEFFPEKKRQQLKGRLLKITSQYIGRQGILHNILKRFSNEGRYVSSQELYCLINSVVSSVVDDTKMLNIFCWIVAAYPQKSWIDELFLLQLENYFKKTLTGKPEWRKYLSKIENKDILLSFQMKLDQRKSNSSISTQCVEDTLRLLSNISNESVNLEGLELSEWPYALKEKYWKFKLSKLVDWQNGDLPAASYYLLSIENIFGTLLADKFIEALEEKKQDLSPDTLTNILFNFHHEKWNLSEWELKIPNGSTISTWAQEMHDKLTTDKEERKITQLVELIKKNANTSKRISDNLPKIENSLRNMCQEKYVITGKSVGSFTEDDIKNWVKELQGSIGARKRDIEETRKEMLAVVERAIVLTREIRLRDTQKLTVLALLTNERSTLAQVSTGEGKSLIVVAVAIMKSLCGEKVSIVTSSSVLAKRDAEVNRCVYNLFGINVTHNCSEDIEKRKQAYSDNQVVYGDLSNFQRDYLLDKFYGKNILGDYNFENVIVDEVDNMLLDKGNNMLYLSHDLAGLDKVESVYIYIWQWINRPASSDHEEVSYAFDTKSIKEAVISDIYGLVTTEDIGKLGSSLSEQEKNIIWDHLVKTKIVDNQGRLLKESIDDNEINQLFLPEFIGYQDRLHHLLKECIQRKKYIHVPNNLRPFIEQHLESWIDSAKAAFFMKTKEDYVVDVDRTGTSPDRNPNITILDRDTGTDQANSQWDEALHQFLQLKHGCKLSLQSLKAVFISNVSFFKLYNNLYGLTGTLGSQIERDLLKEMHEVDFVTIPTAKCNQFIEETPILCNGEDEWIKRIQNEANKLTEEKRSILIICETVQIVETLYEAFGGKDAKHVHIYTRDYEEFDKGFEVVQSTGNKELGQGQIIIATNLAGRGTDIKITEKLRKTRGLHVCLTFLPNNARIEKQAFGRAARNGEKGSGQLIIMDSKRQECFNSKVLYLQKDRDIEELSRISNIKAYYETQITTEETCFKKFKEQYELLEKDLDDKKVPIEVKEILLQSCLDNWAFWLDGHGKYIRNWTDEQDKGNLCNLLDKFISLLKHFETGYSEERLFSCDGSSTLIVEHDSTSWLNWVKGNAVQMIKLGKYLCQNEKHKHAIENAIELFDEVINKEPCFSEAAHYYKAFALLKKVNLEQKPLKEEDKKILKEFKQELREAARCLDEHMKYAVSAAGVIGNIKKYNNESIIQIDAYEKQQKSLANLYYMFSRSIDDIFGHYITPQSFVNGYIKEGLGKVLYEDLLREGVLKKPKVKRNISEKELKSISYDYGVPVKKLRDILSKHAEINEKEFQKELKEKLQLPSRIEFWKSLIEQKVLSEEVKYVLIDNKKFGEVDPSLLDFLTEKVDKKELNKQILEFNKEQIFFNVELVKQNDNNIFIKDDFLKIVGKEKYEVLKERGVLSFNRKAQICRSKHESASFSRYDFITLEDLTKVNITKSEAEKILTELVNQNVIEKKDNSDNTSYRLKIKFEGIKQVTLAFCPVYENIVKGLLFTCFTYRIAFQRIIKYLEEEDFPVRLQLMIKPHQNLFLELMAQKLIRPVTVTTEEEDLEKKLKRIYSQPMTAHDFKCVFQNKLISEKCIVKLFNCLVEKEWITKYGPKQSIEHEGIRAIGLENIKNVCNSLVQDLYYINSPDKRQKPLFPEASVNNEPMELQSIDKTVEKILDTQLKLAKEDTIRNIVSTLKRSRSSLKVLKSPDGILKPLAELFGQGEFANVEEVHVLFLNGLDQLLQLEENKWTREMLLNTAVVTIMGVGQIAIGTAIELYSLGVMTHVGTALVNEGVSDLFFAAGALKSGYFSWGDYRAYKLESLMFTAITIGIGAYFSRNAEVSRFGHKLARPNLEFGGKKIAKMTGTQLIEAAGSEVVKGKLIKNFARGCKVIGKKVVKRITLKTIEGIALGVAHAGVDTLVENYLLAFCEGIASEILSNIELEVEKLNISVSLEEAYKVLGREESERIINELTKITFAGQNCFEEFLHCAKNIASSVTQGIAEAVKKRSKTDEKLKLPINVISKVVVWSERIAQIARITTVTKNFLDNLHSKLKDELNMAVLSWQKRVEESSKTFKKEDTGQGKYLLCKKTEQMKRHTCMQLQDKQQYSNTSKTENDVTEKYQDQVVGKDSDSFKKEVIGRWKSLLREKAGQIIARHIVGPVVKVGFNSLVRYFGKKWQEIYQSCRERGLFEDFEELKQNYEEKLQDEQLCDNTFKTENHITEKYHKDLRKLMIKTRNPHLLAAIVRENIPMDMTCVNACTRVIHKILEKKGIVIPGLTIIVEGDGGFRQRFSSASNGVEGLTIPLTLKNNHFYFCASSTSENNKSSESKNNCLYEELSKAIPALKHTIGPEEFRAKVANCIERDEGIRYDIQQGLHQFSISLGAVGGNLYTSVPTSGINEQAENHSPYQHSNSRGEWKFDKNKDVDLRECRVLTNEETHVQIAKGYDEALIKINQALSSSYKKCVSVDRGNFRATKYDTILCTLEFGKIGIALYPVEMETAVNIWDRRTKENLICTLGIHCDNPIITSDLQGPHGPHIGYSFIPHGKRGVKPITGHILINQNKRLPDRGRSQYSSDDCNFPKIPETRIFFPPNKPNAFLERVETTNIAEIRGRLYPSPDF